MRKNTFLKIALFFVLLFIFHINTKAQQVIHTLNFETNGGYTTSVTETINETTDYFGRIQDGVDSPSPTLSNLQGSYYFGAQDIDGITNTPSLPVFLDLNDINISGFTSLQLRVYLAEDDDGSNQDWDASDLVHFSVDIDNTGSFTDVLNIEATGSSGNNFAPAIDTNFDGVGNGIEITSTFTQFTANISDVGSLTTGSLLDLKVEFDLNSGDEDIAIDHIEIIGIAASSDPSVTFDSATSSVTETDDDVVTSGIPVTLSNYTADVTITPTVNGSSTAEAGDYIIDLTPLTFDANETLSIPLTIKDDVDFDDETIIIDFTVTSGTADLGTSTHTVTITDDEEPPTIGFNSATSSENETDATFTSSNIPITVSNYSGSQIDVNISVTGGTAESGDYTFTSPTALSFSANETQNITVDINDDTDTDDETIIFTITETSAVTGLVISQATHTLTITDDETPPVPTLIITEVADPNNDTSNGRQGNFIEIYNTGDSDIDLASETIKLRRYTNANTTFTDLNLTGTISAKSFYIVGKSTFESIYGFAPNQTSSSSIVDSNGDDQIALIEDTTIFDIFGVIGEDGSNTCHEFEDGRAERKASSKVAKSTWDTADWNVWSDASTASGCSNHTANDPQDAPGDFDPGAWIGAPRWKGTDSNDWDTASNWDTKVLPSSNADVFIESGLSRYPITSSAITINSLTIASGATLVSSNTITTNSATYQRALANASQWYLMSSPVVGETYDNDWVSANSIASGSTSSSNRGVSTYLNDTNDGTTGHWRYLQSGGNGTFNKGVGYGIILSSSGTVSFTGTGVYTSSQTTTINQGASNFNLVGNPFTAFLNLGDFFADNNTANLLANSNIWLWDGSSYNVKMSGTDGAFEIAPGQGFFIEAGSAATTSDNLTFDIADVTHQGTETFQKSSEQSSIALTLTEGNNNRNARLYYIDGTTKGFDNGFDGKLFGGVPHSLAIFTDLVESDGKKYQVQSLPNSDFESTIIPIGLIVAANKTFTISANSNSLPKGINVYLEDRVTETFTLLDENNAFTFTSETELSGTGRFYLYTTSQVLNVNETILDNSMSIYTIRKDLQLVGLRNITNTVSVYNTLGKLIIQKTFTNGGNKSISLGNIKTGVYIIKVENKVGSISKKVIIE